MKRKPKDRVLYVRCNQALLDALEEVTKRVRYATGYDVSRAAVAREMLIREIKRCEVRK